MFIRVIKILSSCVISLFANMMSKQSILPSILAEYFYLQGICAASENVYKYVLLILKHCYLYIYVYIVRF